MQAQEKPAGKRLPALDLLKVIALLPMPVAHVLESAGYDSTHGLWYFLNAMLGAPIFMLCMGFGFAVSRRTSLRFLVQRGIKTLLSGYLLNIARVSVAMVWYSVCKDDAQFLSVIQAFFEGDILQFAGLAMIVTGLMQKTKNPPLYAFLLGCALSIVHTFLPELHFSSQLPYALTGLFFYAGDCEIDMCFPFFAWYLFVGFGYLLGSRHKQKQYSTAFYCKVGIPCAVIAAAFFVYCAIRQTGPMQPDVEGIYRMQFPEGLAILGWFLCFFALMRLLAPKLPAALLSVTSRLSRCVNEIYVIHWLMLCCLVEPLCRAMQYSPGAFAAGILGVLILAASLYLGPVYCAHRDARKQKKLS